MLLVKVYHDLYWVDPRTRGPLAEATTSAGCSIEMARVLKPGGVLLLVDHSAKPGTGSAAAGSLHRIDEAYAKADFEKHGFKVIGTSDAAAPPG